MYRPTNAPIQRARIGVTIHHEMIHPIVSKSSVPVASPRPRDRSDGGHRRRDGNAEDVRDENPQSDEKRDGNARRERDFDRDDVAAEGVHYVSADGPAPRKTKNVISPAADALLRRPAPTAGPHAIPVDEPPILNPTKIEATIPTSRTVSTIHR